jgi:hypothetical protein
MTSIEFAEAGVKIGRHENIVPACIFTWMQGDEGNPFRPITNIRVMNVGYGPK